MIEKIKQEIEKIYNLNEPKGIFMSAFDEKNNLILSNGVLTTDKSLWKVIEMIYHGLIEQHTNITKIICDIVLTIEEQHTLQAINTIDLSLQGLCIQTVDNSKSGVLLPWTIGIHTIQDAFTMIKKKNSIEGNINMYSFSTKRLEII